MLDEDKPGSPYYRYKINTCAEKYLYPNTWVWNHVRAYHWMKKGFLPSEGGWGDQSACFISAMEILIPEYAEYDKLLSQREEKRIEAEMRARKNQRVY